ncbi:MAG: penicillin-insensitive murein endopeptidase [Myxococcaceae bacterium]
MISAILTLALALAPGELDATDAGIVSAPLTEAPAPEVSDAKEDAKDEQDEAAGQDVAETGGELAAPPSEAMGDGGILYSTDLTDEELMRLWVEEPAKIGSISVGLTEAGRLVNGVQLSDGPAWDVIDEQNAWGARETVDFITAAANAVREQFPQAPALRINHIGRQNGGYLRPHQSHQAGRDVDLGFFYPAGEDPGHLSKKRELAMDLATNWALLKALLTQADVEFILVDKRIQARIYAFALASGEDKTWLDALFHGSEQTPGGLPLIRHARRHRDHFHVRFYAARSQELGRRIQPLLEKQPDQNLVIVRVKKGDTLGGLASRHNSTVKLIQKANGLTTTNLSVGRTLNIPIRGPCTQCPQVAPLVVPPRVLPPPPPPKS